MRNRFETQIFARSRCNGAIVPHIRSAMFSFGKDEISEFIKSHATAVIATVDANSQPSTSTIFYAVSKHDEIWFLTKSGTTKFQNLEQNNKAALTILDSHQPKAVNISGSVIEVVEGDKRDEIVQTITKISNETLHDYAPIIKLHKGAFRSMRFIPSQAILTDYTKPMGQAGETLKNY